jgi:hypothetical protein
LSVVEKRRLPFVKGLAMIARLRLSSLLPLTFLLLLSLGCTTQDQATAEESAATNEIPGTAVGPILQTLEAGGYTYVELDTAGGKIWAAGPKTAVQVGQVLRVTTQMPMQNFRSETLDRTFETVYFVGSLLPQSANDPTATKKLLEDSHAKQAPAVSDDIRFDGLAAADYTVESLYAKSADLGGQTVAVRGKVVKALSQIMGRNWLHIQDGTGAAKTNDLVVTTDGMAEVGQTVLITAKVALDKDFGMGYHYDLILEDAEVTVEGN